MGYNNKKRRSSMEKTLRKPILKSKNYDQEQDSPPIPRVDSSNNLYQEML
jgi:hypothetical protein